MPRTKKPRNRRRGKGRRKVATLATVKRLISRTQETKSFGVTPPTLEMGSERAYIFSPLESLAKGTGRNQRVGESIRSVRIKGAIACAWNGTNGIDTVVTQGCPIRVMIVKTPRDITGASTTFKLSNVKAYDNSAELPLLSQHEQLSYAIEDPSSDVKIIKQFWIRSYKYDNDMNFGETVFKRFSVYLPKYDYDAMGSSMAQPGGRHWNYYVVVCSNALGQSANFATARLNATFLTTFKDA